MVPFLFANVELCCSQGLQARSERTMSRWSVIFQFFLVYLKPRVKFG